uniref:DUF3566 domain-containing protein n=1 Tax=Herbidospora sakaeratensis TaxID=564415 RepID=UPI000A5255AD|nr:DUF3566 domain-containing protein [Herbidospora sakaeratensis]
MTNSGKTKNTGAAKKPASTSAASSSMRDGVSARIDDEKNDDTAETPKTAGPTPAQGPAQAPKRETPKAPQTGRDLPRDEPSKTDDSTVRIRPVGNDNKPWSRPQSSNGDQKHPAGDEPTAAYKAPRLPTPVSAPEPIVTASRPAPVEPVTAERPVIGTSSAPKDSSGRAPRKAHLVLRRVEPWSAMKFSFVVSLVCFVVLFVAVAVLYGVLSAMGVFDAFVQAVNQLTQGEGGAAASFNIATWFEPVRILGYTALLGAVNVVLITALSTLGAVIYNLSADLVGGVEVTFSEAE